MGDRWSAGPPRTPQPPQNPKNRNLKNTDFVKIDIMQVYTRTGAPTGGGLLDDRSPRTPQPPKTPQNRNLKNIFCKNAKVLRDLPFSRNQSLKSADD